MEVTKTNFNEILPRVIQSIEDCDFMAMDAELSGLDTSNQQQGAMRVVNPFDTPGVIYANRMRESGSSFAVLQFGLATFKWDDQTESYLVKPFNFFIFPRSAFGNDKRFIVQSSSATFLAEHKFDFNKAIYEGIGYLSKEQERAITKKQEDNASTPRSEVVLKEQDVKFINDQIAIVNEWLSKGDSIMMLLPPCDPYKRRILFQEIPKRCGPSLQLQTDNTSGSGNTRSIRITKITSEKSTEIVGLSEAVGFRKVIDAISNSQKLLVGHNMFLDLVHVYDKFLEDLPIQIEDFKSRIHNYLPKLFDTKLFTTENPVLSTPEMRVTLLKNTVLDDLYVQLQAEQFADKPKIAFDPEFANYVTGERNHEAGFDAFITGFVLLRLAYYSYVASTPAETQPTLDYKEIAKKSVSDEVLQKYINKVFVMRSETCLNLAGPDPELDYSKILFIADFDTNFKTSDMLTLFGKEYGDIRIRWIDNVSAFIILSSGEQAQKALAALGGPNKRPRVVSYQDRPLLLMEITQRLATESLLTGPGTKAGEKRSVSVALGSDSDNFVARRIKMFETMSSQSSTSSQPSQSSQSSSQTPPS